MLILGKAQPKSGRIKICVTQPFLLGLKLRSHMDNLLVDWSYFDMFGIVVKHVNNIQGWVLKVRLIWEGQID